MSAVVQQSPQDEPRPSLTLGDVLYAGVSGHVATEKEWTALVRSVAAGDQLALHGLYERGHRPVFTLMMRITGARETAEELTLEVFFDVWRRASQYDPANGTVLVWIMNQARSRAIERVRLEQRRKRGEPEQADAIEPRDSFEVLLYKHQVRTVRSALSTLTSEEHAAIEATFFGELTHVEAAARLEQPPAAVKAHVRSGLHKLRQALAAQGRK